MKFNTKVIHAGVSPDPSTGAVMTPIYQTSTYAQESPGKHKGYEYARTQNPTRSVLEKNLAALENGQRAFCFGSGLAAMDTIMRLLNPGDEVILSNDLYGGSYRQMVKIHARYGLVSHFVDMTDPKNVAERINDQTKLIWIETPTNPMLNVVDIQAISELATNKELLVCVDNTFASPYLQTPLDLGADLVLHSATKYLGGHSDVVLGAVIVKDAAIAEQMGFLQNAVGAIPGPQDCFLVLRGIKTLHVRVDRACKNAKKVAKFLKGHPKVANVYYPGFKDHPHHEVAKKQMRAFGAMVSFDLQKDTFEDAIRVLSATEVFTLAESLGGVESLIGHPASMTHASIPREERLKVGLTDSLIRLSIGIEDVDDLIEDLERALVEL
ncbi:cystathionine gamma-synthase [Flavilitoribacter nigricans]|uniref:Cystathionine gamma-synthase n=1 Tax=Flavilitoribacter nigricans (strain ATCC 23147 / DSM 23189 / NBRC 102662 / NCIMB 1420 / SS-2) TaxID=1122177 RepID=A0A2D0N6T4_FLAN2|nr:cystathionine gamma-synthase [Flavilitoribacter nigricans]PHN04108.1 cystathionine gamma-synthase [Flavilitoribacter nigricans DSM 23189 = NBRC 102662]